MSRSLLSPRIRGLLPILAIPVGLLLFVGCDRTPGLESIRALHREGRHAEAIEPLRELLDERPEDPEVHFLYGVSLARTGRARVAVWSLRQAAEDEQWKVAATVELAAIAASTGDHAAAIERADRVLEIEPDHLVARVIRAESLLAQGKEPERALEDFAAVLDRQPANAPALVGRAAALLQAGRVDEAAAALEAMGDRLESEPSDPGAPAHLCATRAVLEAERGEIAAAESRFDDCLERFPGQPTLLDAAVDFFDRAGKPERASAVLEAAVERLPRWPALRLRLAERAKRRSGLDEAEKILRAGTEIADPQVQSAAWTALTNLHLERDDLPSAIAAYEHALELAENPPPLAVLTHADLLARAGRHERALEVASGLENDAYRGLIEARIHLDEGRPAEALSRLDEVLPTWPNNAGARYYAARAAERLGDFGRAIEEYRQSIRSAPGQTEAALRLARLHLAAGSPTNAWSAASQHFRAHPEDPEGVRVLVRTAASTPSADLQPFFERLLGTPLWSVAVAARAEAIAERGDADERALASIEEAPGLDDLRPRHAEVLRTKVRLLVRLGRGDEARRLVERMLAAHPVTAAFHAIEAERLEQVEAAPERIEAALVRALELDPEEPNALEARGRLAERAGAVEEAIDWLDRAWAASPGRSAALLRAARIAARSGQRAEAMRRLEMLLEEIPWHATAALELARLRLEGSDASDRTLELAERAVLFRGGEPAARLLIRIHEARGETERAAEITRAIRDGKAIPPRRNDQSDFS